MGMVVQLPREEVEVFAAQQLLIFAVLLCKYSVDTLDIWIDMVPYELVIVSTCEAVNL